METATMPQEEMTNNILSDISEPQDLDDTGFEDDDGYINTNGLSHKVRYKGKDYRYVLVDNIAFRFLDPYAQEDFQGIMAKALTEHCKRVRNHWRDAIYKSTKREIVYNENKDMENED